MKNKLLVLVSLLLTVFVLVSCSTSEMDSDEMVGTYFVVRNEPEFLIVAELESPKTIFMVPYSNQKLVNESNSMAMLEDFSEGQIIKLTLSGKYLPETYPDMIRDCSQLKLQGVTVDTELLQAATNAYIERSGETEEVVGIKVPKEVPLISIKYVKPANHMMSSVGTRFYTVDYVTASTKWNGAMLKRLPNQCRQLKDEINLHKAIT